MIKYEITAELIEKANDYVPLAGKEAFAKYASVKCFDTLKVTAQKNNNDMSVMPNLSKVNTALRNRYLMGAFVSLYLRQKFDPVEGDEFLMSQDEYDNYAGSHIFNEMNRLKSNSVIRDKVFDILSDFKELTAMLDAEIEGTLFALNDTVSRLFMAFTQIMEPQAVEQMLNDINSTKDEIEQYIAEGKSAAEEEEATTAEES